MSNNLKYIESIQNWKIDDGKSLFLCCAFVVCELQVVVWKGEILIIDIIDYLNFLNFSNDLL